MPCLGQNKNQGEKRQKNLKSARIPPIFKTRPTANNYLCPPMRERPSLLWRPIRNRRPTVGDGPKKFQVRPQNFRVRPRGGPGARTQNRSDSLSQEWKNRSNYPRFLAPLEHEAGGFQKTMRVETVSRTSGKGRATGSTLLKLFMPTKN